MPRTEYAYVGLGPTNTYALPIADVAAHTTTNKVDGVAHGNYQHKYVDIGDGEYTVFRLAGASPASSDPAIAKIEASTQAAAAAALTADPSIAAILVDTGTTLPEQITALAGTISTDVLAGLESVSILRVGPGYDPETGDITLNKKDSYEYSAGVYAWQIDFDLTGVAEDFTGANGELIATSEHYSTVTGSATVVDVSGTKYLRCQWTSEQTDVEAGTRHYNAVVLLSDGSRKTVRHGNLIIQI